MAIALRAVVFLTAFLGAALRAVVLRAAVFFGAALLAAVFLTTFFGAALRAVVLRAAVFFGAALRAVVLRAAVFFGAALRAVVLRAADFFGAAFLAVVFFFAVVFFAGLAAGFIVDAFAMACAAALRARSAARSSFVAAIKSFIIFWYWADDMHFIAVDALALDAVRRVDMVRLAMFLTS